MHLTAFRTRFTTFIDEDTPRMYPNSDERLMGNPAAHKAAFLPLAPSSGAPANND
jgi:hypothetical protein